jgi:hypothetical protein
MSHSNRVVVYPMLGGMEYDGELLILASDPKVVRFGGRVAGGGGSRIESG